MTTITWNKTTGGDWLTAGDWSPAEVPGTNQSGVYADVVINDGAVITVASADTISGLSSVTVTGSTLNIFGSLTGISSSGISIGSGGILNVETGGTLATSNGISVASGGIFNAYGTVTTNSSITVNGTFMLAKGATVTDSSGLVVNTGGTATIFGNFVPVGASLSGGGGLTINGGTFGSVAAPVNLSGTNQITLTNGGTAYINSANPPGSFAFGGGSGNTLILTNAVTNITTPITNFGSGDTIEFTNNTPTVVTGITVTAGAIAGTYNVQLTALFGSINLTNVTFTPAITAQITAGLLGTYNVPGITDSQIGTSGHYQINGCFLTGTAIAVPGGTVAVETLRAGDLVNTIENGVMLAKAVKWIGYRSVKPGDCHGDEAHPVRIKAHAFGDGRPARDLLLTNEHCIVTEDGLTPARIFVNGRSIMFDRSIDTFTYYHVELEQHGVLLAEGLAVESYLDTGNRSNFANAPVASLRPQSAGYEAPTKAAQPVAPIIVDPVLVKPIWERLNDRAISLGMPQVVPTPELTNDAELRVVTATGDSIAPMQFANGRALFVLPPGAAGLFLASRTARPCDTVARYIDDRRELGVAVGTIFLHARGDTIQMTEHLNQTALPGWHAPEGPEHRWTSGMAALPIDAPLATSALLEVRIHQAGPYLAGANSAQKIAA